MNKQLNQSALLVTEPLNCRYYHRLQFAAGAVYVSEQRTVYLCWSGRGQPELPAGVGYYPVVRESLGTAVAELLAEDRIPLLTVEPSVPLELYTLLCDAGITAQAAAFSPVALFRETKSTWELAQLRTAGKITDAAFDAILSYIRPGVTELEIAAELEKTMRLLGSEESNRTIVAAGPGSAEPHHWPTDYVIRTGDFVTMNYGCTVNGYHSDLTRTVVVGKASDRQKQIYQTVLEAQLVGIKTVRAGIAGGDVDRASRRIIDRAGFEGTFLHGLGHGIGLDIHEGTGLAKDEPRILRPGMVVSVEPGIYISGYGGVRIEDIGVVLENGFDLLEHAPKELIEL